MEHSLAVDEVLKDFLAGDTGCAKSVRSWLGLNQQCRVYETVLYHYVTVAVQRIHYYTL